MWPPMKAIIRIWPSGQSRIRPRVRVCDTGTLKMKSAVRAASGIRQHRTMIIMCRLIRDVDCGIVHLQIGV